MKCDILFSENNKKKYFNLLPAEMLTQHTMHYREIMALYKKYLTI